MKSIFVRIFLLPVTVYVLLSVLFLIVFVKNGHVEAGSYYEFLLVSGIGLIGLSFILSFRATRQIIRPLRSILATLREFPVITSTPLESSRIPEVDEIRAKSQEHLDRLRNFITDLNLEKELLQSLLNGLREGVICLDKKGTILFQNQRARADLIDQQATGKPYFKVIRHHSLLELIREKLTPEMNTQKEEPENDKRIEIESGRRSYRVVIRPVQLEGEPVLFLVIINDITEELNTRRIREDFLQNASHELKTPITSIRGYAETLIDRTVDEKQNNFLSAILRNTERMESIIEDMVVISSLESRAFPFQPHTLNVQEYLDEIRILVEGTLKRKDQQLVLDIEKPDLMLYADPLLLEHLFVNLISNASRYSPENSKIEIIVRPENTTAIHIQVQDEGPGLPEELGTKIFERFFRVDRNRSRAQGGTGLGLSIVRQITRIHGGKVWAENRKEEDLSGAVFHVVLPLAGNRNATRRN